MKAIVAVDKFWGIGKHNELLYHIPEDLKFFKRQTEGKVVLMGRKTFESLPGGNPLPNRTNLVLTHTPSFQTKSVSCYIGDGLNILPMLDKYDPDDVYVIGGGSIYRKFLHDCDEVFVTHYDRSYNPDTFFPNLYRENYKIGELIQTGEHGGYEYRIVKWVNAGDEPFYKMTGTYIDRNNGVHVTILSYDNETFVDESGVEYDRELMRDYIKHLYNSWDHFIISHDENKVQDGIWRYQRKAVEHNDGIYCTMETYGKDIDECSDNSLRMCDFLHRAFLENNH